MKKFLFFALALVTLVACGNSGGSTTSGVKSITLSKTAITLSQIGSERLTATTDPSGASVTWSSSNPAIATVAANGLVTAAGEELGTATITAKAGDVTATCEVTVVSYFDPKVVDVCSFLLMDRKQSENPNDTIVARDGTVLINTDFTFLLMTNGMMYDREAKDFIGPDQCPSFICLGFGYSTEEANYILGDWNFLNDFEYTRENNSSFFGGVITGDSLTGSYMTECVMGAEGYQFGNIYGAINEGSTVCLDQNSATPRYTLNVTLGDNSNVSYTKSGKATFDEDSQVSVVEINGKKYLRVPNSLAKEQMAAAKQLGSPKTTLVRK